MNYDNNDKIYDDVMNRMFDISSPLKITNKSINYSKYIIAPPLFTNEISQLIDSNNNTNNNDETHILYSNNTVNDKNTSLSNLCDSLIDETNDSIEEIKMESEMTEARLSTLLENLSLQEKPRIKEFNNMLDDVEKQMRMIELEPEMSSVVVDEWIKEFVIDIWNETKPYVSLPEEEMEEAEELMEEDEDEVIIDSHNIRLTGRTIATLTDGTWLNDEIINFYFELLKDRNRNYRSNSLPCLKIHFFNSFFFAKLLQRDKYTYKNVSRWSKRQKVDILSLDKLIIPVNVNNNHWCLSCINLRDKRFEYYDSLGGSGHKYLKALRQYIVDEAKTYKNQTLDVSNWSDLTAANSNVPQQHNGSDCGVFTCKFAEYIVEDRPLNFSQKQMPYFRRRIALEIAFDKLL